MNVNTSSYASQVYATNKTTATKATSAYDTTSTTSTQVDKMDEMKDKYADVYTPIPETYTKESEELQNAKIEEAYPDYVSSRDFLKIVDGFLEGDKIQLGQELSPEEQEKQKLDYDQAYEKAYNLFGGEEAFLETKEIQNDYPVNEWGKDENVQNEKELARFTNAAVYEGLEAGIMKNNMDVDFMRDWFRESIGGTYESDLIDYGENSSIWDLREYGIDGRWEDNNVFENDKAMISELEKKIDEFDFMLNNKDLIEKTNNELNPNSRGQIKTYESKISDQYLPDTQMALDIFKNYKIYDSIDVKV